MDNKLNLRRSPEHGCFEIVKHWPAEASSPLPVGNASNSVETPARPISPGKTLKPAETSPLPAASVFASEKGLMTPKDVKKTTAILPGAPRVERQETDSNFAHNLRSQKRLFADYLSSGSSPVVPDNAKSTAESKKPR